MKRLIPCLGICLLLLGGSGQSKAAFLTYQIKDVGSSRLYVSLNTGQTFSGTGYVGLYSFNFFGNLFGLENGFSRTALQVDISALAGKTITDASLTFDLLDGTSNSFTAGVTSFDANGQLGYYYEPPSNLGTTNATVQGRSSNAIDVTELLTNRVDSGSQWLGLHLNNQSHSNAWTYSGARGTADRANLRLEVNYRDEVIVANPAPSGLLMAGLGIASLLGYSGTWRRNAATVKV